MFIMCLQCVRHRLPHLAAKTSELVAFWLCRNKISPLLEGAQELPEDTLEQYAMEINRVQGRTSQGINFPGHNLSVPLVTHSQTGYGTIESQSCENPMIQ